MALVLTEEQRLLKDAANEFFQKKSSLTEFRRLRDDQDPAGVSRDLWQAMVEQGWAGILIPEKFGGLEERRQEAQNYGFIVNISYV